MLLSLLIAVLIAGLIYWLLTLLPIPDPFKKIVLVIFILICVIWLIGWLPMGGGPYWHEHRLP
jgi:hypothetical protein